jgi:hypothetical protein
MHPPAVVSNMSRNDVMEHKFESLLSGRIVKGNSALLSREKYLSLIKDVRMAKHVKFG